MDVRVGLWRKLSTEELMLLNCSVGEGSWELLGLQGDQTSQSNQSTPKGNQSWIFIGGTDAEDEAPLPWPLDVKNWLIGKDPDARKDWRQEEKGGNDRGWGGWIASLTPGTWVWASSRSWWWTRKPGVLQSMRLQRVGQDWVTELISDYNWHHPLKTKVFLMKNRIEAF